MASRTSSHLHTRDTQSAFPTFVHALTHAGVCAHTYPPTHGHAGGYLTYQNNDYKLLELVFRTPSEHRVDDEYKAGEIHLVHQSAAGRCEFATSTHPSVCLPAYI